MISDWPRLHAIKLKNAVPWKRAFRPFHVAFDYQNILIALEKRVNVNGNSCNLQLETLFLSRPLSLDIASFFNEFFVLFSLACVDKRVKLNWKYPIESAIRCSNGKKRQIENVSASMQLLSRLTIFMLQVVASMLTWYIVRVKQSYFVISVKTWFFKNA